MRFSLLCLLLAVPAVAAAQHPLELASDVAILADVGTTIHALRADPLNVESNPLLPARPTPGTVLAWGALALAANAALPRLLLRPAARPYVWAAVAVLETAMVLHNISEFRVAARIAF